MVRLYIIRHGDPDYDTNRENGGSLTENGRAEATALSSFMASENITHAYSSPLGRARLTAELALVAIPKFSTRFCGVEEIEVSSVEIDDSGKQLNNFQSNVPVEDWCRELSSWRQISHLDDYDCRPSGRKAPAIWDFPSPIIRSQLCDMAKGDASADEDANTKGWKDLCIDYKSYEQDILEFCNNADEFLARHGILKESKTNRNSNVYHFSKELASDPKKRQQKIAIFCHGGMGLTLLSHLLSIPMPMIHASMWLAPSSVTTILFDEYTSRSPEMGCQIVATPRAIQISGTNHLSAAGLEICNSFYEDGGERPAGIKHNFW